MQIVSQTYREFCSYCLCALTFKTFYFQPLWQCVIFEQTFVVKKINYSIGLRIAIVSWIIGQLIMPTGN